MKDPLEQRLLEAALALGREQEPEGLALGSSVALSAIPGALMGGIRVRDDEQGVFSTYLCDWGESDGQASVARLPEEETEHVEFEWGEEPYLQLDLGNEVSSRLRQVLHDGGARSCVAVPLRFGDRDLGSLFLGLATNSELESRPLEHLQRLAGFLSTKVWAGFAHDRFLRGDLRRDALVQLSGVINTSLDLDVVLDRARKAIGSIAGHAHSWIGLLAKGGQLFRCYERPAVYPGAEDELTSNRPVEGSILERLLVEPSTHLSDDLARAVAFDGDEELASRGVRRYVVTPLCVGGRTIGAFLFGSGEARAPLPVDIWLLENVALQLALALENARHHGELERLSVRRAQQNVYLSEEIQREHNFGEMVGSSRSLRAVCSNIERVAGTDSSVLVTGPTGVGKELVARAIHAASKVGEQPMVKLNCAAIAEGMVESELFGHERGAFTSAVERRIGRFELAQDGTLFLDEIGELPLGVQTKLLRVLQDGEFERVGGMKTLRSNARIIAATNRDLYLEIEKGTFRADLFYRLNVFPIEVPPLGERREDIPLLANLFVTQFSRAMGKSIESISPESLDQLVERDWPGNVRELKHVIERAVILGDGPELWIEEAEPGRPVQRPTRKDQGAPLRKLKEVEATHIQRALEASNWVSRARGARPSRSA